MRYRSLILMMFCAFILTFLSSCKKDSSNPIDGGNSPAVKLIAPNNLLLLSLTESSAALKWTDNSTNETAFIIEQGTDSISFATVRTVAANTDTATIAGTFLTTNTYYFRVRAANADTMTEPTNIVSKALMPPPSGMQIVSFAPGAVSLKWTDNTANETGFYIEQCIDGAPFTRIDSTQANATTKTIAMQFDSSKTYGYRIVAHTASRLSAPSNALSRSLGSWIYVAGGSFQMGRNDGYRDERPVHGVTVSGFYLAKYEVTVKEYRKYTDAVKRTFPSPPPGGWNDNDPMVRVSWDDAFAYAKWLDTTTGTGVRLPTEAEWEFAARGGKNSQLFRYSGSNNVDEVAWYYLNASGTTHRVGTKLPNELGLYDMSGNAWEWCADWNGSYPFTPVVNPKGPLSGSTKVYRGGSWFDYGLGESECRVETRYAYTAGSNTTDSGFRIVKTK